MNTISTKPGRTKTSGMAVASILSACLGCFTIGLMIVISEASAKFSDWLNWWTPGGPLIGKAGMGVIVWLVSWALLSLLWAKKEVKVKKLIIYAFALLFLGFLFSFPPFFDMFASK